MGTAVNTCSQLRSSNKVSRYRSLLPESGRAASVDEM
jgi:hypothetical protein